MNATAANLQPQLRQQLSTALTHLYQGEFDEAEALAGSVFAVAGAYGLLPEACRAQRCRAQIALERGALDQADDLLSSALQLAQDTGDRSLLAGSYYARARKEALSSHFAAVEDSLGNTLMHARAAGSQLYEAHAYSLHGYCRSCLGQLEDSRDYWSAGRDIYEALGNREHLLFSSLHLAAVLYLLGHEAAFNARLSAGLRLKDCPNYAQDVASVYYKLAHYCGYCNEPGKAETLLELGREACDGEAGQQAQLALLMARASYREARGDHARALLHWQGALSFAQQRQNRYATAEIRLGTVWTLLSLGRLPEAHATLQDADVAFELFGARLDQARGLCAWAAYHAAAGAASAAAATLASARTKAQLLQAPGLLLKHDLTRAEQALSARTA